MDVNFSSSLLLIMAFCTPAIQINYGTTLEPSDVLPVAQEIGSEISSQLQPSSSESDRNFPKDVESLFEDYWQYLMLDDPEFATSVGDHRYNDKLRNLSLESYEKRKLSLAQFLERANVLLKDVEEGSSSDDNLRLFISDLKYQISELNIRSYLFPISFLDGTHHNLQYLVQYTPLKSSQDYQKLLSRYLALSKQLGEAIELMSEGVLSNMTQHERSLVNIQEQFTQLLAPPEESVFYEPFRNISEIVPIEEKEELQRNASAIIEEYLLPSIQRLADYIEQDYSNFLRPEIGVSSFPNGHEFYQQSLNFHLTAEVTAEEVHSMGLKEVRRIAREMNEVIKFLGFNGTLEMFGDKLRNDPNLFFPTTEDVLDAYRDVLFNKIEDKLHFHFKNIPKMKLTVEKVPEQQANGTKAYYMPGSSDGATPGIFFLDTKNLKRLPKYEVVTLALHEGLPGHHLQISYEIEQDGIPMFRRYLRNNAFTEGWALYSEFLGYDMGLYNDTYALYGHLSQEIFRACRMVVDTGLHAFGWTRQQAIDYMMAYSASTEDTIGIEVDRYITWPGQACSYKYGEMKIKELRNKAETVLGDQFDIKEFHDIVLRSSGPMAFVEQQVGRYIKQWKSRYAD